MYKCYETFLTHGVQALYIKLKRGLNKNYLIFFLTSSFSCANAFTQIKSFEVDI